MASVLDSVALAPEQVSALAEEVPDAFVDILEEGIEACGEIHGSQGGLAAQALFDLAVEMCNEVQ